jgi:hypothetical protein
MEARLCAGSPVVVAGGGNSAGQAALFLAESGSPVTVVIRGGDLATTMSRYLIDRIEADPRITVPRSPGHAWAGCPAPLAGALYTWRICASLSADDNRANERWNSEVAT